MSERMMAQNWFLDSGQSKGSTRFHGRQLSPTYHNTQHNSQQYIFRVLAAVLYAISSEALRDKWQGIHACPIPECTRKWQ